MADRAPRMIHGLSPVPLRICEPQQVEALLDAAFGPDRKGRTAYKLRAGMDFIDHLSFGLLEDEQLIGSIQCWPVSLVDRANASDLILVGPVAVSPERQNAGLGHKLMNAMLGASTPADPPMVMIGDPEYYERFGFYAKATQGWELPGPWERRRLLVRNAHHAPLAPLGTLGPRV